MSVLVSNINCSRLERYRLKPATKVSSNRFKSHQPKHLLSLIFFKPHQADFSWNICMHMEDIKKLRAFLEEKYRINDEIDCCSKVRKFCLTLR